MSLILSLFPGIGLFDRAFEEHGFCVVRGPDLLWGGDVKRFHPPAGRFDGVIGGPPCQHWSALANLVRAVHGSEKVAPDLIPEFERCVSEARPAWFVMENVPRAPTAKVDGYDVQRFTFDNAWTGAEQGRRRVFCWGVREDTELERRLIVDTELALMHPGYEYTVLGDGRDARKLERRPPAVLAGGGSRARPVALGGSGKLKQTMKAHPSITTSQGGRGRGERNGKPRARLHHSGIGAADNKSKKGFDRARRLQGLPDDFDLPPFTVAGKLKALGNGVPLPLGRAIARAVLAAIED